MPTVNPAGTPIVGPGTPYLTPAILLNANTGISWKSIPTPKATEEERYAELLNMCYRATAWIEGDVCHQPLRATVASIQRTGPGGFYLQPRPDGTLRMLLPHRPILSIVAGRTSASSAFPASWTDIDADQFRVEKPPTIGYGSTAPDASGESGQAIIVAPGIVWYPTRSCLLEVTYIHGWPHGSLTAAVNAAATTVTVDDITGWAGAGGTLYDASGQQEYATVTAVTPTTSGAISGPGTLTLAAALTNGHPAGTMFSALPYSVTLAGINHCVGQALTKGATSTTIQTISGGSSGAGAKGTTDYYALAKDLLTAFVRWV